MADFGEGVIKCTVCGSLTGCTCPLWEDLNTLDRDYMIKATRLAETAAKYPNEDSLNVGDRVSKVGGDYTFEGIIVAGFYKLSGAPRYVVEDDRGVLHVYSFKNLKRK